MNNKPIVVEKTYPVPASSVWEAITDKERMKEWYFTINDFVLHEGAEFNFHVPDGNFIFHHRCVIKEIVPQKRFSHTWTHPSHSKGESLVTWELAPTEGGTKVRLTHSGAENFSDAGPNFAYENYQVGWEDILETYLRDYLSKG